MSLILIVEAGSSKTHWALMDLEGNVYAHFSTLGVNPAQHSDEAISKVFKEAYNSLDKGIPVGAVYFYGAGCASATLKAKIFSQLKKFFPQAEIAVESDLLGAARALFGNCPGIACILGTGSNVCVYEGGEIIKTVPSLGYIIGDDGGGFALGRRFLGDLFKGLLPQNIKDLFIKEFNYSLEEIIEKVYREPRPVAFVASFAPFLLKNMGCPEIKELVCGEFKYFLERNVIKSYNAYHLPIGFVGSIASNFETYVRETVDRFDMKVARIIAAPIDKLIEYHSKKQINTLKI